MAGTRTRKTDVKSRLGKKSPATKTVKRGRIRDARDILKKKVPTKSLVKPTTRPTTNLYTKDRVRRLMPLTDILSGKKKKTIAFDDASKYRTLSVTSGSLSVTTRQPKLCRKTVLMRNSIKIVTPSNTVGGNESPSASAETTTRTLTNDLFTRERRSPLVSAMDTFDKDLITSRSNSLFTREYKPTPLTTRLTTPLTTPIATQGQDTAHKNLTKIIVTNLHPRVVQEDIAELFSAVGPLTYVKLEQCVAEVIFAKPVHAEMAYQKYHNRMLDGQAMKCTLGLANSPDKPPTIQTSNVGVRNEPLVTKGSLRLNYSGADLVYPQMPSRPVVFQVRI